MQPDGKKTPIKLRSARCPLDPASWVQLKYRERRTEAGNLLHTSPPVYHKSSCSVGRIIISLFASPFWRLNTIHVLNRKHPQAGLLGQTTFYIHSFLHADARGLPSFLDCPFINFPGLGSVLLEPQAMGLLFIFVAEKSCSRRYVLPNSLLASGMKLADCSAHRAMSVSLHWMTISYIWMLTGALSVSAANGLLSTPNFKSANLCVKSSQTSTIRSLEHGGETWFVRALCSNDCSNPSQTAS